MSSLITSMLLLVATSPVAQSHVRFVVTGDDRWETKTPRPGDENGVNVAGLTRVVKAVIAEHPNALLINGDLVAGAPTDEAESSQFDTYFKVMDPVYDAGIKVLNIRGNHEMHCPHPDDVWQKAMSGKHANPGKGPDDEKGLTYAYTLGNVMFIALDEFKRPDAGVNQGWLDTLLGAPHAPHVFAFGHKMAFFSGNHDDGMFTAPAARDTLLKSLEAAGSRAVFFGHDHLYDHLAAKLPGWTDDQAVHQFVVGTAGAPFVSFKGTKLPEKDADWTLERKAHVEHKLGYAVVDVDGPKVTIVFKAEDTPGVFTPADTFTYTISDRK